jgi:hypothetical protein
MGGQTERVNQILEDMLRACVMENQGSWDKHLPLAKFSYNNIYQGSLKMAPYEVLMDVDVAPCSTGLSQERKLFLAPTLLMKLKQQFVVSRRT